MQISDPHFGTEVPEVARALQALVRTLDPTLVVISGDITQRARRREFMAARRFIEQLERRHVLVIPGNHDIPLFNPLARWLFPYARYTEAFGSDLEPDFESESWLVIGVNSTKPRNASDGELTQPQIARVAARLRSATAAQLRIVVTHHPAMIIRERDAHHLVRGHELALRSWAEAGVDIVMGGHIHLPYISKLAEKQAWVVQAGTAISRRVRNGVPNSINYLRYAAQAGHACTVERWDYANHSQAFECASTESLMLDHGLSVAQPG